jgi:hypothetical protein
MHIDKKAEKTLDGIFVDLKLVEEGLYTFHTDQGPVREALHRLREKLQSLMPPLKTPDVAVERPGQSTELRLDKSLQSKSLKVPEAKDPCGPTVTTGILPEYGELSPLLEEALGGPNGHGTDLPEHLIH